MVKPRHTGFNRVVRATVFSWQGLTAAWRHESAFRQECVLTLLMTPVAFMLGENLAQTALLVGVCFVVLIAELLNSAIEAVVDRVGHEPHDLAGQAKDMGSAAVMMSIVLVQLTWLLVALNRFFG
jgi:diacylglycerol kinase (ATP)